MMTVGYLYGYQCQVLATVDPSLKRMIDNDGQDWYVGAPNTAFGEVFVFRSFIVQRRADGTLHAFKYADPETALKAFDRALAMWNTAKGGE